MVWIVFGFCLLSFRYFINVILFVVKILGKACTFIVGCLVEKCVFTLSLDV